jgi:hypothetical protein
MKNIRRPKGDFSAALSRLYNGQSASSVVRSFALDLLLTSKLRNPPFSPFEFAKLLGIAIEYRNVAAEGIFVHGATTSPKIFLPPPSAFEADVTRRRRNFTLAHEIGHYLIRRALTGFVPSSAFETESPEEEFLCDNFAAELLMPTSVMLVDVKKGTDPLSLLFLTERYDVSLTALLCRANKLCKGYLSAIIWYRKGRGYQSQ